MELHTSQSQHTEAQLAQMQALQSQSAAAQAELVRQLGEVLLTLEQTVADQGLLINALQERPAGPSSPTPSPPVPKASSPPEEDDNASQASQSTTQIELALGVRDPT